MDGPSGASRCHIHVLTNCWQCEMEARCGFMDAYCLGRSIRSTITAEEQWHSGIKHRAGGRGLAYPWGYTRRDKRQRMSDGDGFTRLRHG